MFPRRGFVRFYVIKPETAGVRLLGVCMAKRPCELLQPSGCCGKQAGRCNRCGCVSAEIP